MSWGVRHLLGRLGVTPEQEATLFSAIDRLGDDRPVVREEIENTRRDLARVVRSGVVDDAAFEELFARHDRVLAQLRVSVIEVIKQTVETLDERQRKMAADRIDGGGSFWGGGPFGGRVWA